MKWPGFALRAYKGWCWFSVLGQLQDYPTQTSGDAFPMVADFFFNTPGVVATSDLRNIFALQLSPSEFHSFGRNVSKLPGYWLSHSIRRPTPDIGGKYEVESRVVHQVTEARFTSLYPGGLHWENRQHDIRELTNITLGVMAVLSPDQASMGQNCLPMYGVHCSHFERHANQLVCKNDGLQFHRVKFKGEIELHTTYNCTENYSRNGKDVSCTGDHLKARRFTHDEL